MVHWFTNCEVVVSSTHQLVEVRCEDERERGGGGRGGEKGRNTETEKHKICSTRRLRALFLKNLRFIFCARGVACCYQEPYATRAELFRDEVVRNLLLV